MKAWMDDHIMGNSPDLIQKIIWTPLMKASLLGIFSKCDIEEVEIKANKFAQIFKLLEILVTKRDEDYVTFMHILEIENQFDAFTIFKNGLMIYDSERWNAYIKENTRNGNDDFLDTGARASQTEVTAGNGENSTSNEGSRVPDLNTDTPNTDVTNNAPVAQGCDQETGVTLTAFGIEIKDIAISRRWQIPLAITIGIIGIAYQLYPALMSFSTGSN